MGRGRGKGKKLAVVMSHEDLGNGDDVLPAYKRRGRPLKPLKDDADEVGKIGEIGEEEDDDPRAATLNKEMNCTTAAENGKKRKRYPQLQDKSSSLEKENGVTERSNFDDSTRSSGFRQKGSRRKSTPRRAAEAVVECN